MRAFYPSVHGSWDFYLSGDIVGRVESTLPQNLFFFGSWELFVVGGIGVDAASKHLFADVDLASPQYGYFDPDAPHAPSWFTTTAFFSGLKNQFDCFTAGGQPACPRGMYH